MASTVKQKAVADKATPPPISTATRRKPTTTMSSMPVSFTVRRPTPVSRPSSSGPESDGPFKIPALPRRLANTAAASPLRGSPRTFSSQDSSDDEESGIVFANDPGKDDSADSSDSEDFGSRLGGQRSGQKKKKASVSQTPLVIPAKPNPDWREAARRRRAGCARIQPHTSRARPSFVPDSAPAKTGADGSVGGLGTRDSINSGPQLSGLQINQRVKAEAEEDDTAIVSTVSVDQSIVKVIEETEDQKALRAILAGEDDTVPVVDIIPVPPLSEEDALKQDVQDLPDVATADDYERVPISAFGAAMLRGMGWTDGAVAPKSDKRGKNALKELYLPKARPALLGIGAKEKELVDDGSDKKKSKGRDMRYIPVTRAETGRSENNSSRSGTGSRRSSRSPSRRERENRVEDREKSAHSDRERGRERDRDRDDESRQRTDDRTHERRDRKDRGRDRDEERDDAKGRSDSYRDREREGKGREHDGRDRDRTRERDRRDRRDNR